MKKFLIVFAVLFLGLILLMWLINDKRQFIKQSTKTVEQEYNITDSNEIDQIEQYFDENYELLKDQDSLLVPIAPEELPSATYEKPEIDESLPVATVKLADIGTMKFQLYPDKAPNTVDNFISLANSGFYDGLTMHRFVPGFVIQGGDPNGDGSGGPGYEIDGEYANNDFAQNDLSHDTGALAMARSQSADSAGSQFYIVLDADNAYSLNNNYTVFGQLIEGIEVLDEIDQMASNPITEMPLQPIAIESITVDTKGVDYQEPETHQEP